MKYFRLKKDKLSLMKDDIKDQLSLMKDDINYLNTEIWKLKNPPSIEIGEKLEIVTTDSRIPIGKYVLTYVNMKYYFHRYWEYVFVNTDTGKQIVLQQDFITEHYENNNSN